MDGRRVGGSEGRGWLLVAALAVTSCFSDNGGVAAPDVRPVSEIVNWVGSVFQVAVGDSTNRIGIWVAGVDGDYITREPTVTVADTTVAVAGLVEFSRQYYPPDGFELWMIGKTLGRTTITLQIDTVSIQITALTGPDSIRIGGLPDSFESTATVSLTATALDANGEELPGLPITWSASPSYRVEVTSGGVLTAKQTGESEVYASVVPPDESYGGGGGRVSFRVNPTTFPGSIAPPNPRPGDRLTLHPANLAFTPSDVPNIGPVRPLQIPGVGGDLTVVFPVLDTVGTYQMRVVGERMESVNSIMVTSLDPVDELEPNNDPLTAPAAVNGYHVLSLSGDCAAGSAVGPGADCSAFLTVTNTTADSIGVEAGVAWLSDMDVDLLWTDASFTTTVGNLDGAIRGTGPDEEYSFVRIPPGATWRLWINVHESHGVPYDVLLLRIDGIQ